MQNLHLLKNNFMQTTNYLKLTSILGILVFSTFTLMSCKKDNTSNNTTKTTTSGNNNNNTNNTTLHSQVLGKWKLVKEHWQMSNNQDTILTTWKNNSGAIIIPTMELGNQVATGTMWYTGGLDKMGFMAPCNDPFSRGNSSLSLYWNIEESTNRLVGGAYAKYVVAHIDANNMTIAQKNYSTQYSFDTLWLQRY